MKIINKKVLLIYYFILSTIFLVAQYQSTGASTYVGVNRDNSNWNTETSAFSQNDTYCEITTNSFDNTEESDLVRFKGFGFNIPPGSVISGIEVEIDRNLAAGSCIDNSIRLLNVLGVEEGSNMSLGDAWLSVDLDNYNSFGGEFEMWGTTLTAEDINDPNFGVSLQVVATSNNTKPRVDHVKIKVFTTSLLPVSLVRYDVSLNSSTEIQVDWTTVSEIGNSFFSIEKSIDMNVWTVVGEVQGNGNSSDAIEYQFIDKYPFQGESYYRLKQTDFNGSFSYSPTKSINILSLDLGFVYPVVSRDYFTLKVATIQHVKVSLFSSSGGFIRWINPLDVNTRFGEDLKNGVYFLKIQSYNSFKTLRIIKR